VLDAEGIFFAGERGFHLLFDTRTIAAAFEEDATTLRRVVGLRRHEVEQTLARILELDDLGDAREVIAGLAPELRHVLVLLYFELLEGRVRRYGPVLH
jgi:hypothetical protein